jgi:hypothetical protein
MTIHPFSDSSMMCSLIMREGYPGTLGMMTRNYWESL